MIGVVAHLGGQVKGAGQAGLAGAEQELETFVGRLGRAETGVLAHGPELAAIHRGLHAAGVRKLAGPAELCVRVKIF